MNNQQILENAPEGATHVDEYGIYLNTENDSYWKETSRKWVELTELLLERNTRLLADIARIAELEKELAKTKQPQKSGWLRDSNTHVNKSKEQDE